MPSHLGLGITASTMSITQRNSPAVGFHARCALFHSTCALVPPILRQSHKTASARVARCGTTRGLVQDWWNFLQDRRTSRGTRAHLARNSTPRTPRIGACRVETYSHLRRSRTQRSVATCSTPVVGRPIIRGRGHAIQVRDEEEPIVRPYQTTPTGTRARHGTARVVRRHYARH